MCSMNENFVWTNTFDFDSLPPRLISVSILSPHHPHLLSENNEMLARTHNTEASSQASSSLPDLKLIFLKSFFLPPLFRQKRKRRWQKLGVGENWGTFLWIKWNKFTQSHLRVGIGVEKRREKSSKSRKSWQKLQIAFIITTRPSLSHLETKFEFLHLGPISWVFISILAVSVVRKKIESLSLTPTSFLFFLSYFSNFDWAKRIDLNNIEKEPVWQGGERKSLSTRWRRKKYQQ